MQIGQLPRKILNRIAKSNGHSTSPVTELSATEWVARPKGDYANDIVARFTAARTFGAAYNGRNQTPAFTILAAAVAAYNRPVSILDFGGAAGFTGLQIRAAFGDRISGYVVVETKQMVSAASGITGIELLDELPNRSFDIVYSSGTLHFSGDPLGYLAKLAKLSTGHLILTRNAFSASKRYFSYDAALFDHGGGPLPDGFQNETIRHYFETLCLDDVLELTGPTHRLVFSQSDSSGIPGRLAGVNGEDLYFAARV